MSNEKTFTIEQIRYYLTGNLLNKFINGVYTDENSSNDSLKNAITELEDYEDGIDAVCERRDF